MSRVSVTLSSQTMFKAATSLPTFVSDESDSFPLFLAPPKEIPGLGS